MNCPAPSRHQSPSGETRPTALSFPIFCPSVFPLHCHSAALAAIYMLPPSRRIPFCQQGRLRSLLLLVQSNSTGKKEDRPFQRERKLVRCRALLTFFVATNHASLSRPSTPPTPGGHHRHPLACSGTIAAAFDNVHGAGLSPRSTQYFTIIAPHTHTHARRRRTVRTVLQRSCSVYLLSGR